MPNYRRLYVPVGTYFFTVNLRQRSQRLLVEHIDLLRQAWRATNDTWPFEMVAVCILPDHLHCLWTLPEGDHDFSTRWRLTKTGFSRALPVSTESAVKRRAGERGIWQRRFWEHLVRDPTELEDYINYIHYNPVKHGHASEMDDWPYSSWHRYKRDMGETGYKWRQGLQTGEA